MSDDPITDLMNDLRSRGAARLIHGSLGEPVEDEIVTAWVFRQPSLWGEDDPANEELVVTLDTLETILRWGRRP